MAAFCAITGIMLPAVSQAVTLFGAWGEGLSSMTPAGKPQGFETGRTPTRTIAAGKALPWL
jgi:hypothetical protein